MTPTEGPEGDRPLRPMLTVASVARRLGIAPSTLRTWDRRYGLGPSEHTAGAHRRYGPEDLARLVTMRRLTLEGVSPAEAAQIALATPLDPAEVASAGLGQSIAAALSADHDDDAGRALAGDPSWGLGIPAARADVEGTDDELDLTAVGREDPVVRTMDDALPESARRWVGARVGGGEETADGEHGAEVDYEDVTDLHRDVPLDPHIDPRIDSRPSARPTPRDEGWAPSRPGTRWSRTGNRASGGGRVFALPDASPAARGLARAAMALDTHEINRILRDAVRSAGVVRTWDVLALPVLAAVGQRWRATGEGVDVEHVFSECLLGVFRSVTAELGRPRNARPVLLACAEGDYHTLPLHALAAALAEDSIACRMLGSGMPPEALTAAVRRSGPAVVFLFARLPIGDPGVLEMLPRQRPAPRVIVGVLRVASLGGAVDEVRAAVHV